MTPFPAPESRQRIVDQDGVDQVVAARVVADQIAANQLIADRAEFDEEVALHDRRERRLLWKEGACIAFVAVVVVIRQLWLT